MTEGGYVVIIILIFLAFIAVIAVSFKMSQPKEFFYEPKNSTETPKSYSLVLMNNGGHLTNIFRR